MLPRFVSELHGDGNANARSPWWLRVAIVAGLAGFIVGFAIARALRQVGV